MSMGEVVFRAACGSLAPTDDRAVFSRDRGLGYLLDLNQSNRYIDGTGVTPSIYLLP